jgi:WD40 repeat protein
VRSDVRLRLPAIDLNFVGSDDFQLRVYNYNTSEKVTSFEAHPDYIRAIAVHPTQPFVLTASVRTETIEG